MDDPLQMFRFKLAIQEVPAGYANEASQIIEEARIAGVYPELPPLTAVLGKAQNKPGEMRGIRELIPVKAKPNSGLGFNGKTPKKILPKKMSKRLSKLPPKIQSSSKFRNSNAQKRFGPVQKRPIPAMESNEMMNSKLNWSPAEVLAWSGAGVVAIGLLICIGMVKLFSPKTYLTSLYLSR